MVFDNSFVPLSDAECMNIDGGVVKILLAAVVVVAIVAFVVGCVNGCSSASRKN